MKDVTSAKGVSDLRTALTTRVHAKPPQKGTAHLDLYLLSKEKQRLEKELVRLERQQRRVQEHLAGTVQEIAKLQQEAQLEDSSQEASTIPVTRERQSGPPPDYSRRPWKKMTLDY
jgi:hypothetical protein